MIMTYDQVAPVGGVITFPDYPITAEPTPPNQLLETAVLGGCSTTAVSVTGSVDSPG